MAKRKRGRHTGRFESGETWGAIPTEVLGSTSYAAIPDYAARVLLALAAQYRGRNNGNLSLTVQTARELGVRSAWKVQAGLRLLLDVGLLEMTRPGKYSHGRGVCALYAMTWRKINPTAQAFPPIEHERPAPNTWANWQRPHDWQAAEANARRAAQGASAKWNTAYDHSRRQEQARSRRQEQARSRRQEQESTRSSSRRLGDLLDSGRGGASVSDVHRRVAALVRAQPHLSNADVAKIFSQFQIDAVQVAAIRGAS